jgi:C-terminal processing protease CtpA/Prc
MSGFRWLYVALGAAFLASAPALAQAQKDNLQPQNQSDAPRQARDAAQQSNNQNRDGQNRDAQSQNVQPGDDQNRNDYKQNADDDDETEYRGLEHAALGAMFSERGGQGVSIRDVMPNSPAQRAGLRVGDRIVKIDSTPTNTYRDVIRVVNRAQPGQSAKITIERRGEDRVVPVTFASHEEIFGMMNGQNGQPARGGSQQNGQYAQNNRNGEPNYQQAQSTNQRRSSSYDPDSQGSSDQWAQQQGRANDYVRNNNNRQPAWYDQNQNGQQSQYGPQYSQQNQSGQRGQMGMQRQGYNEYRDRRSTGGEHGFLGVDLAAVIHNVRPGSAAEQAGLRAGDEIVAIDDQPIRNQNELVSELQNRQAGDRVQLRIQRDGQERNLNVRLGSSNMAQRQGSRDQYQDGNSDNDNR